jgi:hypothetical protein
MRAALTAGRCLYVHCRADAGRTVTWPSHRKYFDRMPAERVAPAQRGASERR